MFEFLTSVFSQVSPLAGLLLIAVTLPGSLELLALTAAGLAPRKPLITDHSPAALPRLALVVPAHNEAAGIAECVANLRASLANAAGCELAVIADNCSDATAEIARAAGARVLVRQDAAHRGKGYALDFAFKTLLAESYDVFLVVDADSRVDLNLVHEFRLAFAQGIDAAQCRYRIANPDASLSARINRIAWLAFNDLRLAGREKLNVSVGILGNGFALSRRLLEAVPYEAGSIVEDMEYHLRLVKAGYRMRFLDSVHVYSDAPNKTDNAEVQRSRWEGGRFGLIASQAPSLFRDLLAGQRRLLEPLAELLLLPLSYHVLLLLLTLPFSGPPRYYALAGLTLVILHVLAAVRLGGDVKDLKALASVPMYIIWKLKLIPNLLRNARKNAAWQRTDRENS